MALLSNEMPADIVNPLKMKYIMYCIFLVLVLVSAAMEVSAQCMYIHKHVHMHECPSSYSW